MSNKSDEKSNSALAPKLRFPEFRGKDTWKTIPLSKLAERCNRKNSSGELTLVLTNSAEFGVVEQRDYFDKDIASQGNLTGYYVVERGDYVYNPRISRAAPVGPISKNNIATGVMSPLYTVFRFKSINNDFYAHYFKTTGWHSYMRQVSSTGARHDRMAVSNDDFMAMPLPVSSPAEQQKIVDCLISIDEVIAAQRHKLDALKSFKKGLLQQIFPREGERVPRLRFREFKGRAEWKELPLSELVESLDAGVSVNAVDRPATNSEIGVLKISAVTSGIFDPQDTKAVVDGIEIGRVKEAVQADTIIINRGNTPELVGASAYVETSLKNIFLPDLLWAAKPKPGTCMRFLAYFLGTNKGRAALSKLATGTSDSMKKITKSGVLALLVMAPSPAEQQHIASCLTSVDELIAAQGAKLEFLNIHKKGLMQQLFPSLDRMEA